MCPGCVETCFPSQSPLLEQRQRNAKTHVSCILCSYNMGVSPWVCVLTLNNKTWFLRLWGKYKREWCRSKSLPLSFLPMKRAVFRVWGLVGHHRLWLWGYHKENQGIWPGCQSHWCSESASNGLPLDSLWCEIYLQTSLVEATFQ